MKSLLFASAFFCCLMVSCVSNRSIVGQPEKYPEAPRVPEYIMGKGIASIEDFLVFFVQNSPHADLFRVHELASLYISESALEGVNHDIAFIQMCLETGFLAFGGLVTPDMHNYCGLGAIGPGQTGNVFPDAASGVRAHIQHLKAYASEEPLTQELIDPRFKWVRRASAPRVADLAGKWASDPQYGEKLNKLLQRLYSTIQGIGPSKE
jgi:hypothetical protein